MGKKKKKSVGNGSNVASTSSTLNPPQGSSNSLFTALRSGSLVGHKGSVLCLSLSPNATNLLASGSEVHSYLFLR